MMRETTWRRKISANRLFMVNLTLVRARCFSARRFPAEHAHGKCAQTVGNKVREACRAVRHEGLDGFIEDSDKQRQEKRPDKRVGMSGAVQGPVCQGTQDAIGEKNGPLYRYASRPALARPGWP